MRYIYIYFCSRNFNRYLYLLRLFLFFAHRYACLEFSTMTHTYSRVPGLIYGVGQCCQLIGIFKKLNKSLKVARNSQKIVCYLKTINWWYFRAEMLKCGSPTFIIIFASAFTMQNYICVLYTFLVCKYITIHGF